MELSNQFGVVKIESQTEERILHDFDDDELHDECGVFGIYAPELQDVARTISLALIALQHRGQESCGIVTSKGKEVYSHKGIGLVSQVFNNEDVFTPLKGGMGIGHNRYATSGKNTMDNTQPVTIQTYHGELSIAQNGNLATQRTLKNKLMKEGVGMFKESDCEVIAQMLASNSFLPSYKVEEGPQWEKRIQQFMHLSDGAYSLVLMVEDAIYACRDHLGMRPLCIGSIMCKNSTGGEVERFLVASESCALIMAAQAKYIREVLPGEIVRLDKDGLHSFQGRAANPAFCIFEYVYFARPDSLIEGQLVVKARERMGKELAKEHPCAQAEIVVGVPDSSLAAAIGYSQQSGIPYAEGIMKNRYVHRTFIQPTQTLRQLGVSMKFTPIEERLKGKKIVLVDDSIVRGNTIANLIKMLRTAGAVEIHVRIASPPVISPCFMGIDLSTTKDMVAHNRTVEQVQKEIGADSLSFLSVEGMEKATKEGLKEPDKAGYCRACFTGEYPLKIDDW